MRSSPNPLILTLAAWAAATTGCSGPSSGASGASQGAPASGGVVADQDSILSTKELVRQSKPAIVRIVANGPGVAGVGTGFFVEPAGAVVTNLHVVVGAAKVEMQLLDGRVLPLERVRAYDLPRDLVLFEVQGLDPIPTLALADSDRVEAGDPVIAIGNPLGVFDYTVSDGLVSSVRTSDEGLVFLQITAPISQGSSGGPLFNQRGEVIGVVRAFVAEGQNINFGIPSNYVRSLATRDDALSLEGLQTKLLEELEAMKELRESTTGQRAIERRIPRHDIALIDACPAEALADAVREIGEAINLGAPLYNQGNHEACYRIYEGTARKLERESPCPGVRDAMGQGLLRASTESDDNAKAWALRDAFDGLIEVVARKLEQTGP